MLSEEQGTLLRVCDICAATVEGNDDASDAKTDTEATIEQKSDENAATPSAPDGEELFPDSEEMKVVEGRERATLVEKILEAEECAICLEPMQLGSAIYTTACNHRFHWNCLKEIQKSDASNYDKCPSCRSTMSEMQVKKHCEHPRARRNHKFCRDCGEPVKESDFKPRAEESHPQQHRHQQQRPAAPPGGSNNPVYRAGSQGAIVRCPQCQMQMRVLPHMFNMRVACPSGHQFRVAITNNPPQG